MRKPFLFILFLVAMSVSMQAQRLERDLYSVAFYNVENLFDTIHDVNKDDAEFLPGGRYDWGTRKYTSKLKRLAQVLSELSRTEVPQGPAFIGLAEVENSRVLDDLVKQPGMEQYRYIQYEGPDKRGIDCALLYDPSQYEITASKLVLSEPFEGDTTHLTRGFLIVDGRLANERLCVIVNHWPSRGADSPVRIHAARQVRALTDSLHREDKRMKIVVMGDLNDDPMDESLAVLGGKKHAKEVKKREFFNPWWAALEDLGVGTLVYRGKWNLFDQILLNKNLLKNKKNRLRFDHHEIFMREYLFQQDGQYKGTPLRTHGGKNWLDGYSDHLPTIIYLRK